MHKILMSIDIDRLEAGMERCNCLVNLINQQI